MRDGSSLLKSLRPGCHRGDLVSLRRLREDLRAVAVLLRLGAHLGRLVREGLGRLLELIGSARVQRDRLVDVPGNVGLDGEVGEIDGRLAGHDGARRG